MSFLLDTNVISEVRKPNGDRSVKAWLASVAADDLYLSVLAVGEIRCGVERLRRRDPGQTAVYETWLDGLQRDYGDRIIPITDDAMLPLAAEKVAMESKRIADIKSRKALRPGWLDAALLAAGVIKEGETL